MRCNGLCSPSLKTARVLIRIEECDKVANGTQMVSFSWVFRLLQPLSTGWSQLSINIARKGKIEGILKSLSDYRTCCNVLDHSAIGIRHFTFRSSLSNFYRFEPGIMVVNEYPFELVTFFENFETKNSTH